MLNQAESLLEAVRPDLYRVNAFRVAQLPTSASQRDITRRLDRLTLQAKLGGDPERPRDALALAPAPDLDSVRAAIERLRDPERRLLDEFFWFWPDEAQSAVERGDVATARKMWQASTSAVAIHNLAVLAHVMALDLEHRALEGGNALDRFLSRMRDQAWSDAWKYWKAALNADETWDRFQGRIRELDEPQLPPSLVKEFRRALRVALLGINAQLAVQCAERRLPEDADRHRDLLKQWDQDPIDADEALRRALRPVRQRIKALCETAPAGGAHDHWQTAVDLFQGVSGLPARAVDRDNLLEDVGPALHRICWFCQKQASDAGSGAAVPLHGRVVRTRNNQGESVHWDRQFLEVPRCWQCSQAHQRWALHQALGTVPVGTRPESEKAAFPVVAKFLAEGWGIGLAPEGL